MAVYETYIKDVRSRQEKFNEAANYKKASIMILELRLKLTPSISQHAYRKESLPQNRTAETILPTGFV
jgi:hypothetical protein